MTDSLGGSPRQVLLKLQHAYESLGSLLNCDFSYDGVWMGLRFHVFNKLPGMWSRDQDQARHTVASPGELWKHTGAQAPLPEILT